MPNLHSTQEWFKSGSPWIWLNAAAVSASLIMVFGLIALIIARGQTYFWPSDIVQLSYLAKNGDQVTLVGELWDQETVAAETLQTTGYDIDEDTLVVTRRLLKVGNRDLYASDFRLILEPKVREIEKPSELMTVIRREWGNFYGYLLSIREDGTSVASTDTLWSLFQQRTARALDIHNKIEEIEDDEIGAINYALEALRLRAREHELEGTLTPAIQQRLTQEREALNKKYAKLQDRLKSLYKQISRDTFTARIQDGRIIEVPFSTVIRAYQPNQMGVFEKLQLYAANIWEFVSDEPREANTEGGVFPAIFGTVMMVIIMAILVTPLGVIAAVYLREYARQGPLTRIIRIAVNNLAGVPSIVYGVFGLGFFVYFLGGSIDALFFPEALPAPTFGTGGIMWASLTLAILTLPVVIVATEEGLSRIPRSLREGSLALGATKFETLWKTILPISSPAILTGLILAIARAAGEVAPLMLVGVVKLAPSMPMDSNPPFVHLERKFMHLGFHIYDVGFQSPNVEAARPLVYATALLLVIVIVTLNLAAIQIRNRLREKYLSLET